MAKKKNPSLSIHDFFGSYNTYRIFALRSERSMFAFANKLSKALNVSFTLLSDFEYVSDKLSANFAVFYAEYAQQETIHCLLLENKTATNQQELFSSKTVKKPNLVNYSLFEESLYLFNNNGLHCFELEFPDMDYLLLLFSKKNIENDIFAQFSKNLTPFKAKDISFLLKREQTSAEAKKVSFLRDFFCKYEVHANRFLRRKKMELLSPVKQIPVQNLQYRFSPIIETDSLYDNLQLSSENLVLLAEE